MYFVFQLLLLNVFCILYIVFCVTFQKKLRKVFDLQFENVICFFVIEILLKMYFIQHWLYASPAYLLTILF